jgi:hypothetical protein
MNKIILALTCIIFLLSGIVFCFGAIVLSTSNIEFVSLAIGAGCFVLAVRAMTLIESTTN